VDIHVTYPEVRPNAPGRKYNLLLAKYDPRPSFLVCTTHCVLRGEEESTDREQLFLVSSVFQSQFDRTAEASHLTHVYRFSQKYLSRVVRTSGIVG